MLHIIVRFLSRLFLWLKVLRVFRGLTLRSELNLWISAFIDTFFYAFSSMVFNPKLMLKGLCFYRVRELEVVVVRGSTDDFYHLIPGHEGDVDEFIRSHLRKGSVFVDVGANVGYYTLIASKLVGSQGRIYAIEPVPSTATILKANVKLNDCDNVIVYKAAAWSSKGEVTLGIPRSMYGYASIVREGSKSVTVRATTLDEILWNVKFVDLIKIDVEGAEYEVLCGAKESLSKVKYMVIELSRNAKEVLRLLIKHGFRIKKARLTAYILAYRS